MSNLSKAEHTTRKRRGKKQAVTRKQASPAPDPTPRGDTIWRWGAIPYILTLWAVSRVLLTGIGLAARDQGTFLSKVTIPAGRADWLNIWSAWDSSWYYFIADQGYLATSPNPHGFTAWAFFPFYSWVTRAVATVAGDTYVAALLVSNVSLLIGAWLLYKLVEQHHDGVMARKTVLFLFLFPTAYSHSCLLTEGLFFALTIGAWYCASRRNWLLAGLLGMASSMTRLVGLFMAPLLALEYLRQRQWNLLQVRPDALWIGLVPVGLGVFMAVCYTLTGNPLQFVEAQNHWGPRANPLQSLWWSLNTAWRGGFALHNAYLGFGSGAIAAIAAIGVLLWGRKQTGTLLCLWSLAQILLALASHVDSTPSMPRYLAVIFPLFMILASLRMNSVAFVITVVAFSLLQVATFALWTLGWTVAI